MVENSFLSNRDPKAISQNFAVLLMQTVKVSCYMNASRILSQETCGGFQGDVYSASIYLLIAGAMDLNKHLVDRINKND
jgi:hypothetical protein